MKLVTVFALLALLSANRIAQDALQLKFGTWKRNLQESVQPRRPAMVLADRHGL